MVEETTILTMATMIAGIAMPEVAIVDEVQITGEIAIEVINQRIL